MCSDPEGNLQPALHKIDDASGLDRVDQAFCIGTSNYGLTCTRRGLWDVAARYFTAATSSSALRDCCYGRVSGTNLVGRSETTTVQEVQRPLEMATSCIHAAWIETTALAV